MYKEIGMFRALFSSAVIATMVLTGSAAFALSIDFRDPGAFSAAYGQTSYATTIDGVSLELTPTPAPNATLYWDSTDGIGVMADYEADEIEGFESLIVDILSPGVYLNSLHITDLFIESSADCLYTEIGYYQLNGGDLVQFSAVQPTGTNGELIITFADAPLIDYITLTAPGLILTRHDCRSCWENHEFSLAGIDVSIPVPEPASAILMGAGLLGAALLRRRK